MISDCGFQISDLRTLFITAVQAAKDLPPLLCKHAEEVTGLEMSRFDRSYLEFLDEQIALSPRGPEWTSRLVQRRAGLAKLCEMPLLNGRVLAGATEYWVKVYPFAGAVVYWEEYVNARSPSGRSVAESKSEI
jgi:hypothetical protein